MEELFFFGIGCFLLILVVPLVLSIISLVRTSRLHGQMINLERRMLRLQRGQGTQKKIEPEVTVEHLSPGPTFSPSPECVEPIDRVEPEPPPSKLEKVESSFPRRSFESVVGEQILPRLGVGVLVVGIALLLWYAYERIGPREKLALAGITGLAMLATGVRLFKRERFRIPATALMAGGWAVVYTTAYAAYFVPAAQVVESPLAGFLILMLVATGTVLHALRYQNEWVCGLAYLLIFATLLIFGSHRDSLLAMVPVTLSFAVLVRRFGWIRLCTLGALALYATQAAWLKAASPGVSVLMPVSFLLFLWLVWLAIDFLHAPSSQQERIFHAILIGVNFCGLVALGQYIIYTFGLAHSYIPPLCYGLIYAAKGILGRRHEWIVAHGADLTFGLLFLDAAAHRCLPGIWPAVSWIGLGGAVFLYGVLTQDAYARFLGHGGIAVALFRVWAFDRDLGDSLQVGEWKVLAMVFPAILGAVFFYGHATATSLVLRLGKGYKDESTIRLGLTYVATTALALAIWYYPPPIYCAVLYTLLGVLFLEIGFLIREAHVRYQGLALALLAAVFTITVNLNTLGTIAGISRRLISMIPVLTGWCVIQHRVDPEERWMKEIRTLFAGLVFAGVLGLLHFELGSSNTPIAWMVAAVAWVGWSDRVRSSQYLIHGTLALIGSTVFFSATQAPSFPWVGVGGMVAVGIPLVVMATLLHLWVRFRGKLMSPRTERIAREILAITLAASIFIVLARTVSGTWLTGSWAALGLGLTVYGFLLQERMCRWSSLAVLAVCLVKLLAFDFPEFTMPVKITTTIGLGAVMIAMSFVYARHRQLVVDFLAKSE